MSHLEGKNTHQNDLFLGCLKGLSASCPQVDNCLGCQGLTKMSQKFWRGVLASAPYCGWELKLESLQSPKDLVTENRGSELEIELTGLGILSSQSCADG